MMIQIVRVLLCEKRGFDTYENQMSIRFKFILFYFMAFDLIDSAFFHCLSWSIIFIENFHLN